MPAADLLQGLPKPRLSDAPSIEASTDTLIDGLVGRTVMRFTSAANRTAVVTSPVAGMVTWMTAEARLDYYTGSAWTPLTPGAWTPLTYETGYTARSGSPGWRLVNGSIQLRGLVERSDLAPMTPETLLHVATLPTAARPSAQRAMCCITEYNEHTIGRVDVQPSGHVEVVHPWPESVSGPHWVSLDGVQYAL